MIAIGQTAPDFSLPDDSGKTFRLSEHRGTPLVLVFYPQAGSEGCTTENLEFDALLPAFTEAGVKLVSISPDRQQAHVSFRAKNRLGLTLLSDPDHQAIEPYGLWALKKMYGIEFMGLIRATIIVDARGKVAAVIKATRIKGHARKVLDAAEALFPA